MGLPRGRWESGREPGAVHTLSRCARGAAAVWLVAGGVNLVAPPRRVWTSTGLRKSSPALASFFGQTLVSAAVLLLCACPVVLFVWATFVPFAVKQVDVREPLFPAALCCF